MAGRDGQAAAAAAAKVVRGGGQHCQAGLTCCPLPVVAGAAAAAALGAASSARAPSGSRDTPARAEAARTERLLASAAAGACCPSSRTVASSLPATRAQIARRGFRALLPCPSAPWHWAGEIAQGERCRSCISPKCSDLTANWLPSAIDQAIQPKGRTLYFSQSSVCPAAGLLRN